MLRRTKTAVNDGVDDGDIQFRLLCSNTAAAGLIGHSGTIINRLSAETSSKIHVSKNFSSFNSDRLVYVTGSSSLSRTIRLAGEDFQVSVAAEALFRVFERLLEAEVEASTTEAAVRRVTCRLLVEGGLVGGVIGKGGERIKMITKSSGGACIDILRAESLPRCIDRTDELIMIAGESFSVKKALVLISGYVQKKWLKVIKRAHSTTFSGVLDQSKNMQTSHAQMNKSVNERAVTKVVFKLLCPDETAAAIIGFGGRKIKNLEEETGALIFISSPARTGCHEHLVSVSAFENRKMQHSFAQDAIVRLFNEIVSFSSEEGDTVTARLLIRPDQSDWLNAGEVSIISAIQTATGATLQVFDLDCPPKGAADDGKVLQIDGDYPNVQVALFQVSWRLRENVFETSLSKNNTPLLPHEIFAVHSTGNKIATLTDEMNKCTVSKEVNGSLPRSSNKNSLTTNLRSSTSDSHFGSGNNIAIVTKTKLEITVRADVFSAVYGDNGNNLARLRQISGATVEVNDPCSGNEGKVIISGTRDQTLVAQSLLQAFLMAVQ